MGKSTKPRKAYKPARISQRMPIVYGIDSETKTELAIAPLMSINMFTSGRGSESHAYAIINTILTGYHLARGEAELKLFFSASDAMKRVLARGSYDKWGFSGDDLQEITAAVKLSDKLQSLATRRQMRDAVYAVLATTYPGAN